MVLTSDYRHQLFGTFCRDVLAGGQVEPHEGTHLECKEDPSRRGTGGAIGAGDPRSDETARTVADAVTCFASAEGGIVVLGVDDRATGPHAFVGSPVDAAWLTNRIRQLVGVEVHIADHTVANQRIVTVTVDPSAVPVSDTHNRYRRRQGRDCQEMSGAELASFAVGRETADWSAVPSAFQVGDVSAEAIAQVRSWLRATAESSRIDLADADDLHLLRVLGLANADGRLNRAGELLMVDVADRGPLMDASMRPAAGADTDLRIDPIATSLASVLGGIEAAIDLRNPLFPAPAGLAVGQLPALPKLAYREAIVNAVMHRDWGRPEPVRIELEGLQLAVISPGGFLPGVTEDTVITAPAKTRNHKLAAAFRGLRLAEAEGSGVDRMFRETVRVGLPKPSIQELSDGSAVRCVIFGGEPDPAVLAVVASLPAPQNRDVDVLLLLDALEAQPTINATRLAAIIQKTHAEAVAAIGRANLAGLVQGSSRSGHYRLTDQHRQTLARRLTYLRRTPADHDALVRQLLTDHAEIRARDLIELASLSSVQASRVLAACVASGTLIKHPSADAVGAGVHYTATR